MSDDLLVRNGEYYDEPKDQKDDRKKDRAKAFDATALIEELLAHKEERINFYRSIDSITTTDDTDKFMHQIEANKLVVAELELERSGLQDLYERYHKK